ncbi:MAG TPA: hypothetical protein V6C86_05985 [Oculatellaceae cyanobacterium]
MNLKFGLHFDQKTPVRKTESFITAILFSFGYWKYILCIFKEGGYGGTPETLVGKGLALQRRLCHHRIELFMRFERIYLWIELLTAVPA